MIEHGNKMIIATTIRFILNNFCLPFTINIRGHLPELKAEKNN
jgi:hypothetical protein